MVREALRLLEQRECQPVAGVEELKAEIAVGLAQLRRGAAVDGDSFFAALNARRASAE